MKTRSFLLCWLFPIRVRGPGFIHRQFTKGVGAIQSNILTTVIFLLILTKRKKFCYKKKEMKESLAKNSFSYFHLISF